MTTVGEERLKLAHLGLATGWAFVLSKEAQGNATLPGAALTRNKGEGPTDRIFRIMRDLTDQH